MLCAISVLIKGKTVCGRDEKGEGHRAFMCWQEGAQQQFLM